MTTAIGNYKETQTANTSTILPIFSVLSNSSAIGQSTDLSSDVVYKEAKAFRFTAAVATDFYTPQFTVNSNQTILQTKSLELQAFHYKKTSVNSYERSQNLHSVVANTQYCYATNERFVAAPIQVHQASKQIFYGDRIKIQAGKLDQQRVSGQDLGTSYGRFDVGAINDITFTSKNKGILLQGKEHVTILSDSDVLINSEGRTAFTSKNGMAIKSDGEVSLNSGSNLNISSTYSLVINGGMNVNISGKFVTIGGAATGIGSISLDVLSLSSQVASAALSGNIIGGIGNIVGTTGIGDFLRIPTSISNFSNSILGQLPEQLRGVVTPLINTTLNSLVPGRLSQTINNFTSGDFLNTIGNFLPANLAEEARQYSGIINAVIPSFGSLISVFNRYEGDNFYFDDYPRIEDVPALSTAPSTNPFSSVVIDGVNYYITPNGQ
jgi:hypothetical protein